jgi:hypothetical protein
MFMAVCLLFQVGGCFAPDHEGFAIYLTEKDIPPDQMPPLDSIAIADKPLISLNDITSYDPDTHEIILSTAALDRISGLQVPTKGRWFLVCVDKQPLYWGAFWTPISSQSFDGVIILKPLASLGQPIVQLELGYPGSSFYQGADPRNNATALESLRQSGKLSSSPPAFAAVNLPASMKGYELYSWFEDNQWHFTLMTGTNRNKNVEEIISIMNYETDEGWVHIHVAGVENIKTVLRKLPSKEFVIWLSGPRLDSTGPEKINFTLPAEPVIENIRQCAADSELNFNVSTP